MKKYSVKVLQVLLTSIFLVIQSHSARAQEIVIAFDKTLSRASSLDGMARAQMLVRNMAKVDVNQAMFLIHTQDINRKTVDRLMFYDDSGQLLVNAGAKYSLLSRKNAYTYQIDILKANAELEQYVHYQQHIYFPYLYEGGDEKLLQQLHEFLANHYYQPTYVTYVAKDDYLDSLYQLRVANNKNVNIRALEKVYVNLLMDDILAYDARAHLFLGYSPRQIILLHENDLAAYFIVALVDALNAKGFKVVSPEKVFSDPVANPFFSDGYSVHGYMKAITGISDSRRQDLYEISTEQRQKIHRLLTDNGLAELIP